MTRTEFLAKLNEIKIALDTQVTAFITLYDEYDGNAKVGEFEHGVGEIAGAVSLFEDANNELKAAYDYATDPED